MFLGKGDSARLDVEQREALANLRRLMETGHIVGLEPSDTEVALRAITFFERWEGAVALLHGLRNTLLLVAAGLGFWWATGGENFITAFIRKAIE